MCLPWPSEVFFFLHLVLRHLLLEVGWPASVQWSLGLNWGDAGTESGCKSTHKGFSDFITCWFTKAKLLKYNGCHWVSEDPDNGRVQEKSESLMRCWTTVSCILPTYKYHYAMPSPFAFPASFSSMREEKPVAFRLDMCNHHDLV